VEEVATTLGSDSLTSSAKCILASGGTAVPHFEQNCHTVFINSPQLVQNLESLFAAIRR
jgi:hypothetical protein